MWLNIRCGLLGLACDGHGLEFNTWDGEKERMADRKQKQNTLKENLFWVCVYVHMCMCMCVHVHVHVQDNCGYH